jgi:microcystin-dependent protein
MALNWSFLKNFIDAAAIKITNDFLSKVAKKVNANEAAINPAGAILVFAGSAAPTGWLLCDGSAVSRATYATLFAIISTTYGSGDGSTTFNLPNLKGRVPVGKDAWQTEFDTLGKAGGHKLLQSHNHTLLRGYTSGIGYGSYFYVSVQGSENYGSITTGDAGGGNGQNMPPYIVLNYIIKT